MLLWPVITIGGVRKFLESWVNGAGKMHPQVLALLSDVFESRSEIAPDPLPDLFLANAACRQGCRRVDRQSVAAYPVRGS